MQIIDALPAPDLPLPLQQHPFFARAVRAMGCPAEVMALSDGPRSIGHTLMTSRCLLPGWPVGLASQGPHWQQDAAEADQVAALRLMRKRGLCIVNARKGATGALVRAGFVKVMTDAHVAELDLYESPDAQRARMRPTWRNKCLRAAEFDTEWRSFSYNGAPDHWLLRNEAALRRARKYHALPPSFASAWAQANLGQARIFAAFEAGEPIAGMLFLMHHPVVTYHMAWSGPAGRARHAHNLLLEAAMNLFAEKGFKRMDLGTIDTETSPGLARFKLGTGARAVQLGGTWVTTPKLLRR